MNRSDSYKNLIKSINKVSYRHNAWKVFSDFLEMSAIAISNSVDLIHRKEREKRYLEIINSYEKEDQEIFPEMFAYLVNALEYELDTRGPTDVLGKLFHELELHNKWKGQFFTPIHICEAMGMMTVEDKEHFIKEKGFITVAEPCVGSGAMVLGFAKAMQEKGLNYCSQMVVTAQDIDIKCVHMTYIQLSLYGIPAKIIHGNSITFESWAEWFTPTYILDGWMFKQYKVERSKEMSKIFGEFKSIEDLNKTALNLRGADEKEEVWVLGQENMIDEEIINKFIDGEIDYLAKPKEQKCRVCGCTDNNACPGGCYWEEQDLCSKCAESIKSKENVHKNDDIVPKSEENVHQKEEIVHLNESAVEKLERELKEIKDERVPAEPIAKYLIDKCKQDNEFTERVKLKDKSLRRCFDYVFNEVKKKLDGNNGWVADDEVYQMAETYWLLNITELRDIEIKETKEIKKSKKITEKKTKPAPSKKKVKEEVKKILEDKQVSIFDIVG